MTKLNQIIAIEKGAKAEGENALTQIYHAFQKAAQWSGITRTYTPKDDDGDQLPPEQTLVQLNGAQMLGNAAKFMARQLDVTATKDDGNTSARADVVVDGQVLLSQVPVATLLTLEKKLDVLRATVLTRLPVVDPAFAWSYDADAQVLKAAPEQTVRTKKVPRSFTKAPATDKHPAQVEMFTEDVNVGTWTTTRLSGAFTSKEKADLLAKVGKLAEAVKKAREDANSVTVTDVEVGQKVFEYLGWL